MKNSEYWAERFRQLEASQNQSSESLVENIQLQMRKAEAAIENKINAWYGRLVANNNLSMAEARKLLNDKELEEFRWEVEDYIHYGEKNAVNGQWMKQLENASARVHISRLEQLKLQVQQEAEKLYGNYLDQVDGHMKALYEEGFYHTAYEIQKGTSVGWNLTGVDSDKLEKIIKKPWAADGKNFSDRIWSNKQQLLDQVHTSLTQMCILGQSPDKAISSLAKAMNTSRNQAGRLIMTESAFFSSEAQKDCFNELGVEEYEIVATLDSYTSEICQMMDGKHFPMSEFKSGATAPPFHVNCRSCTCPYFDDEFTVGEKRIARGEDGKTYYVDSKMTYPEWKKTFANEQSESIPNMNISGNGLKKYTQDEIREFANQTEKLVDKYVKKESRWSGKIIVDDTAEMYGKLWNCDIMTTSETSPHIILHEQLHARSISYHDVDTYTECWKVEEAAVQFLTQEISRAEGLEIIESQYDGMVDALRNINEKVQISGNDMDFAIKLFQVDVTERLNWLESKVYEKVMESGTIAEYEEFAELLERLR